MATEIQNILLTRFSLRIDTESKWNSINPILLPGELAISYSNEWSSEEQKFNKKFFSVKSGDGIHNWKDCMELLTKYLSKETRELLQNDIIAVIENRFASKDELELAKIAFNSKFDVLADEISKKAEISVINDKEKMVVTNGQKINFNN